MFCEKMGRRYEEVSGSRSKNWDEFPADGCGLSWKYVTKVTYYMCWEKVDGQRVLMFSENRRLKPQWEGGVV